MVSNQTHIFGVLFTPTTFLLFNQPSREANTMGTLISNTDEVAINAKITNYKAIFIVLILQSIINRNCIPINTFIGISRTIVIKCIVEEFLQ